MEKLNNQKSEEKGMTLYDLNSKIVEGMPALNLKDIERDLLGKIKRVLMSKREDRYFALMAPGFKYFTLFLNKDNHLTINDFTREIYDFMFDKENCLGELKDYYLRDDNVLEIWFDKEYYALYSYERGVVEL